MAVEVVFFGRPKDNYNLEPFTQRDVEDILPVFDESKGDDQSFACKFVTLQDENEDLVVVLIGPIMYGFVDGKDDSYFHKELLEDYINETRSTHKIKGGGYVKYNPKIVEGQLKWVILFHDRSGDFGVFDPRLLIAQNRAVLLQSFQPHIFYLTCEWKDTLIPPKSKQK